MGEEGAAFILSLKEKDRAPGTGTPNLREDRTPCSQHERTDNKAALPLGQTSRHLWPEAGRGRGSEV